MKKIIFNYLLFFSMSFCFAQNEMETFDKKILPATESWIFTSDKYSYGEIKFQIARNANVGILKISVDVSDPNFVVGGNLYIDFEDASFIVCTDKKNRKIVNNQAIAYYNLTSKEIDLLKLKNIKNIRFQIIGKQTDFSSKTGHQTAYNFKKAFAKILQTEYKYETATEIKVLFE